MSWIALTAAHIESRFAVGELDAIEETGGGSGDRLTGILEQVTALVRAKVSACHKNTLGVSGTIPEECLHAACTLAAHDIRAALPSYVEDTDIRRDAYRNANKFLDDVASCSIGITTETSSTQVNGSDSGSYGGEALHSF